MSTQKPYTPTWTLLKRIWKSLRKVTVINSKLIELTPDLGRLTEVNLRAVTILPDDPHKTRIPVDMNRKVITPYHTPPLPDGQTWIISVPTMGPAIVQFSGVWYYRHVLLMGDALYDLPEWFQWLLRLKIAVS